MNKHYALTDLHGMWELWEQVSKYCDETDTIYFLGDAADRGPDGIRIILALLRDKRVKYLKGNHEELLIDAIDSYSFIPGNGTEKTYNDFLNLDSITQQYIRYRLGYLPNQLIYTNPSGQKIILNHSGFTRNKDKEYIGQDNPYIWDRDHIYEGWNGDENTYIVHGHTPVPYLITSIDPYCEIWGEKQEADEILNYCVGHKFDLDIASFLTKKVALFNLDALKVEKYFYC